MKNKQSNFYLRRRQLQRAARQGRRTGHLVAALPGLVAVGGLLAAFGVATLLRLSALRQVATVESWCQNSARQAAYQAARQNQALALRYQSETLAAQAGWAALATYPVVTGTLLGQIQSVGSGSTLVFDRYDSLTGQLCFTVSLAQVSEIPGYVRALEDTGLFAQVGYRGYDFTPHSADASYTISPDCILAAPGREGQP